MSQAETIQKRLDGSAREIAGDRFHGVGTDLVDVSRLRSLLSRGGPAGIARIFSVREIEYCEARHDPAVHFAGRLAAKEAVYKALHLTWNGPFAWKMIEILPDAAGAPVVAIDPAIGVTATVDVSISHDGGIAVAVAIARVYQGRI